MIRLVTLLSPREGVSTERFHQVLRDRVGPLVAGAQTELDLIRYTQLHADPRARDADDAARAMREMPPSPAQAMADFWWSSCDALDAVCEGDRVSVLRSIAQAADDVVDPDRSSCWLADEYPQVLTGPARVVARPRTSLLKLAFMLMPAEGMSDAQGRHYWLTRHGPFIRSHAPARGMTAYHQVHRRSGCDDDARRLATIAQALGLQIGQFMGHAEAWFDRSIPRCGPEFEDARSNAVVDERRFIGLKQSVLFSGKEYPFVEREWAHS